MSLRRTRLGFARQDSEEEAKPGESLDRTLDCAPFQADFGNPQGRKNGAAGSSNRYGRYDFSPIALCGRPTSGGRRSAAKRGGRRAKLRIL